MTTSRPTIVGSEAGPEPPYPVRMEGPVIKGFGRGSKELGIPTANMPVDDKAAPWIADCESGVYFGWAKLGEVPAEATAGAVAAAAVSSPSTTTSPAGLYPMVMSIGFNPFYNNTSRTAEVHILHDFAGVDFYGAPLRIAILGYIRPERGDYASVEALVEDIHFDCDVARRSLARPAWTPAGSDGAGTLTVPWLLT
ncbi:riboflavin kinase [Grosmannia clavigera kw1407]|uniref:Riboflavin kinase n=1 Tax=Grosmannia clavigera (strain kw1407 / UAMH 11150) TaxID=655863 RepID=F0XMU5_GROCL|nr:riboflavin kinase [Grosmannia clavigera kw1407]EFX01097.1 riboflavin kinase [Grosmannia clavigera kw1407]